MQASMIPAEQLKSRLWSPWKKNRRYVDSRRARTACGVSLGTVMAVAISWSLNKSIAWALVHGLLGWAYVAYAAFTAAF